MNNAFTRRVNEEVVITERSADENDDQMSIRIVSIEGDKVRMSFDAAPNINVIRTIEGQTTFRNVLIKVLRVRGESVRLAFEYPAQFRVERRELYVARRAYEPFRGEHGDDDGRE